MTKQLTLNQVVKEFKAPEKSRSAPSVKEIEVSSVELALRKKKHLEGEILTLEKQIFALETSYLENTAQIGDLVRGWGDIATALTAVSGSGSGSLGVAAAAATHMKKRKVMDSERIFSSSSVSARELLQQQQADEMAQDDGLDFMNAAGRPGKMQKTGIPSKKRMVRKKSLGQRTDSLGAAVEPLFDEQGGADLGDM